MVRHNVLSSDWSFGGVFGVLCGRTTQSLSQGKQLARELTPVRVVVSYEQSSISISRDEACDVHVGTVGCYVLVKMDDGEVG